MAGAHADSNNENTIGSPGYIYIVRLLLKCMLITRLKVFFLYNHIQTHMDLFV